MDRRIISIGCFVLFFLSATGLLAQLRREIPFNYTSKEGQRLGNNLFTLKVDVHGGVKLSYNTSSNTYEFDFSGVKPEPGQPYITLVLSKMILTRPGDLITLRFRKALTQWPGANPLFDESCFQETERISFSPSQNGQGEAKFTYDVVQGDCRLGDVLSVGSFSIRYQIRGINTGAAASNPTVNPTANNKPKQMPIPAAPVRKNPDKKIILLPAERTACVYRDFIRQNQGTPVAQRADSILQSLIVNGGIQYRKSSKSGQSDLELFLSNIVAPNVDTVYGAGYQSLDTSGLTCLGRLKIAGVENQDALVIRISDAGKPAGVNTQTINLGNILVVDTLHFGLDSIVLSFSKGKPPYRVTFYNALGALLVYDDAPKDIRDTHWVFPVKNLLDKGFSGDVKLEVTDSENIALYSFGYLVLKQEPINWYWLLLLVFPILFYWMYRRRQQKIQQKYQRLKEEKGQNMATNALAEADLPGSETGDGGSVEPEAVALGEQNGKTGGVTIKNRRTSPLTEIRTIADGSPLPFSAVEMEYAALSMQTHWDDSAVKTVYLHRGSIADLDLFIRAHKQDRLDEKDDSVPEIGGLLLGEVYQLTPSGQYIVRIEKFIQVRPEMHDTYQLEFSTESLAQELGAVQDQFPNLMVLGWFHTHPGHGLFLSKPDMAIQEGFFNKPYQFAMEIDTLTQEFDTGFFTRRSTGQVNNAPYLRPGSGWFAWTEIEKITRKRK